MYIHTDEGFVILGISEYYANIVNIVGLLFVI